MGGGRGICWGVLFDTGKRMHVFGHGGRYELSWPEAILHVAATQEKRKIHNNNH
jgi:hypothetical protein